MPEFPVEFVHPDGFRVDIFSEDIIESDTTRFLVSVRNFHGLDKKFMCSFANSLIHNNGTHLMGRKITAWMFSQSLLKSFKQEFSDLSKEQWKNLLNAYDFAVAKHFSVPSNIADYMGGFPEVFLDAPSNGGSIAEHWKNVGYTTEGFSKLYQSEMDEGKQTYSLKSFYDDSHAIAKLKYEQDSIRNASQKLPGVMELLKAKDIPCSCEMFYNSTSLLWNTIQHLNDEHKWTREAIADWIDELHDKGLINAEFEPWDIPTEMETT